MQCQSAQLAYMYFISAKCFDPTVSHFQALQIVENIKVITKISIFLYSFLNFIQIVVPNDDLLLGRNVLRLWNTYTLLVLSGTAKLLIKTQRDVQFEEIKPLTQEKIMKMQINYANIYKSSLYAVSITHNV